MQANLAEGATTARAAPWRVGVFRRDLKFRDRFSLLALLLGLGLLWPLPAGGMLLMVGATFGPAISREDELIEAHVQPTTPHWKETQ